MTEKRTKEQIARDYYVASGRGNSTPRPETLKRIDDDDCQRDEGRFDTNYPASDPVNRLDWRVAADAKAEDLRQLLITLDFRIQESSAISCRETLCKIEAKTQEIRNILARA